MHGESGIPEGSYPFWKTLFEAISGCGRKIEIDMHAKGVDQTMIDIATATGMPVKLGAKYSAEHQSLGYNQADIRELEIPQPDRMETGVFSVSNGARRFTRYGYADFLQQGTRYQLLFRLWPGTSGICSPAIRRWPRLSGAAPASAARPAWTYLSRLPSRGAKAPGSPGGRCAYADASLNPKSGDWEKFEYFYRVWGRCLYDPDADPESWRRYLKSNFGTGALLGRKRFGQCQPGSGVGDVGSSAIGIESCLLGRDLHQHAHRAGEQAVALQRYAYTEVFCHR